MVLLLGRGAAYLLVRAVFVMFYRAGAEEDICAANRAGKQGQSRKTFTGLITPLFAHYKYGTHRT